MKLTRIAVKGIAFMYFLFKLRNFKIAFLFSHYHVELTSAKFLKVKGRNLLFTATDNQISIASLSLFKLGFPYLLKVLNSKSVQVKASGKEGVILDINGITLKVKDHSGIATIQEIFIEGLYQFHLGFEQCVVLDIGMNTGYASLFFASMKQVDFIYSFEPFKGTFNEALDNFNLNPHLAGKIFPACYGISNSTDRISVPLFESGSTIGSTDKNFIENNIFQSVAQTNVEVEIRSIDSVLDEVRSTHPTIPIVLKIDCEGEEYNIIEQIQQCNQWHNIYLVLMEWHMKGSELLLKTLTQNNFTCIDLPRIIDTGLNESKTGMIYAMKKMNKISKIFYK